MLRGAGARVRGCDDSPGCPGAGSGRGRGRGAAPGSEAGGKAGDQGRPPVSTAAKQQGFTHHHPLVAICCSGSRTAHLICSHIIAGRQRLARVLSVQPRLSAEAAEGSPDIGHLLPLRDLGAGDTDWAQRVSEGGLLLVPAMQCKTCHISKRCMLSSLHLVTI